MVSVDGAGNRARTDEGTGCPSANGPDRRVILRDQRDGRDQRHLWAYVDSEGSLHVDGQDLGPSTAPVSDDGEYEWFTTVRATHVLRLVELLGGDQDSDVLDLLTKRYSGMGSYELERVIRESDIPVERLSADSPA